MPITLNLRLGFPPDQPPDRHGSKQYPKDRHAANPHIHKARREVISLTAQGSPSLLIPTQRLCPRPLRSHVSMAQLAQVMEAGEGARLEDTLLRGDSFSHDRPTDTVPCISAADVFLFAIAEQFSAGCCD